MTTSTDIAEALIDHLVTRHQSLVKARLPPLAMDSAVGRGLTAMREWYYFAETAETFKSDRKQNISAFVDAYKDALRKANDAAEITTKRSMRPAAKDAKAALDALRVLLKQVFTARFSVLGRGDAASNLAEYLGEAISAEMHRLTLHSQADKGTADFLGGLTLLRHFFAPNLSENYGFPQAPPSHVVGRVSELSKITKELSLGALLNPPYTDDLRGATGHKNSILKYSVAGTSLTGTCALWWNEYERFRTNLIHLIGKCVWIWGDGLYCIEMAKRVSNAKRWVYSTFFTEKGAPRVTVECKKRKIRSSDLIGIRDKISGGRRYGRQIRKAFDGCNRLTINQEWNSFADEIEKDLVKDLVGDIVVQTLVTTAFEAVPFVGALVATARAAHACGVALAEVVSGEAFETRVEWVARDEESLSGKYFALTTLSRRYSGIQTVAATRGAAQLSANAALKWTPIPNIVTALINGGVEGALRAGDLSFEAKLANQVSKMFPSVGSRRAVGGNLQPIEDLWEVSGLVPSLLCYLIEKALDPAVPPADTQNTDGRGFFGDLAFLLFADEKQGQAARRAQLYLMEKNEKSPFPFVVVAIAAATGGPGTT